MGSLSLDICIGFKTNIPRECDGHMRIGLGLETGGFRGTKDKEVHFFRSGFKSLCGHTRLVLGMRSIAICFYGWVLGLGAAGVKAYFAQG